MITQDCRDHRTSEVKVTERKQATPVIVLAIKVLQAFHDALLDLLRAIVQSAAPFPLAFTVGLIITGVLWLLLLLFLLLLPLLLQKAPANNSAGVVP